MTPNPGDGGTTPPDQGGTTPPTSSDAMKQALADAGAVAQTADAEAESDVETGMAAADDEPGEDGVNAGPQRR